MEGWGGVEIYSTWITRLLVMTMNKLLIESMNLIMAHFAAKLGLPRIRPPSLHSGSEAVMHPDLFVDSGAI